ncbi:MAG: hypothetical protein WCL10_07170 [Novosphingobium sp.]|uniref:hypothetical protein n=1 Tax=Novosphingobium sp. TaxID=1874826 RepID=UPI003015F3B5
MAGLVSLCLFAHFGWTVLTAFRTGVMQTLSYGPSRRVDRREQPVSFWFEALWGVFLSGLTLVLGVLALYEAHTLPSGQPAQTISDHIMPKSAQL